MTLAQARRFRERTAVAAAPLLRRRKPPRSAAGPDFHCRSRIAAAKIEDMLPTRTSLLYRVRNQADEESWREFVALYEPLLLSYVRKRGLSQVDARDVVQDIFIQLLRILPTFTLDHSRGRFRTWLWQVVMNGIAD